MKTPRRRWLAFGLRILFLILTLFACSAAWVGWQLKLVRERHDLIQWIVAHDGVVDVDWPGMHLVGESSAPDEKKVSWIRDKLGDYPIYHILLSGDPDSNDYERSHVRRAFPEAIVECPGFEFAEEFGVNAMDGSATRE